MKLEGVTLGTGRDAFRGVSERDEIVTALQQGLVVGIEDGSVILGMVSRSNKIVFLARSRFGQDFTIDEDGKVSWTVK